jgi:hypothetical protein
VHAYTLLTARAASPNRSFGLKHEVKQVLRVRHFVYKTLSATQTLVYTGITLIHLYTFYYALLRPWSYSQYLPILPLNVRKEVDRIPSCLKSSIAVHGQGENGPLRSHAKPKGFTLRRIIFKGSRGQLERNTIIINGV